MIQILVLELKCILQYIEYGDYINQKLTLEELNRDPLRCEYAPEKGTQISSYTFSMSATRICVQSPLGCRAHKWPEDQRQSFGIRQIISHTKCQVIMKIQGGYE